MIHLLGGKNAGQSGFISNCYHHHGDGNHNADDGEDGKETIIGDEGDGGHLSLL